MNRNYFSNTLLSVLTMWSLFATCVAQAGPRIAVEMASPVAEITLEAISGTWDGDGFMPVLITIKNADTRPRTWEFDFESGAGYGQSPMRSTASVSVPGASTQTICHFAAGGAPKSRHSSPSLRVRVSGPGTIAGRNHHVMGSSYHSSGSISAIGVSPRLERPLDMRRAASGDSLNVSTVNLTEWPADWRTLTPFHDFVISDPEYASLDVARREALDAWVATGGRLYVYEARERLDRKHGAGQLVAWTRSLEETDDGLLLRLKHGGGHRDPWSLPGGAEARSEIDADRFGFSGWLIVFLIGFCVLVGPVNLFMIAPAARRHRLFLTVPLLSVAASVVLAVIIVWRDGFGGAGVRQTEIVLFPASNQAVVFQGQVARTGVLLGRTFPVPEDVWLAMAGNNPDDGRASGPEFARAGGVASGGWFTSRSKVEQQLKRVMPTRARIEVIERDDAAGRMVVQSSVPTVLRDFEFHASSGHVWLAEEVPPGQRVVLKRDHLRLASAPVGTFRAKGGASELGPVPTLDSIRWTHDVVFYSGRLEELNPGKLEEATR